MRRTAFFIIGAVLLVVGAIVVVLASLRRAPVHRAEAMIEIRTDWKNAGGTAQTTELIEKHLDSQPGVLTSERVIRAAFLTPQWEETRLEGDDQAVKWIQAGLKVERVPYEPYFLVSFTDTRREAVALVVDAVVEAYRCLTEQEKREAWELRLKIPMQRIDRLRRGVRAADVRDSELRRAYAHPNLQRLMEARIEQEAQTDHLLQEAQEQLAAAARVRDEAGVHLARGRVDDVRNKRDEARALRMKLAGDMDRLAELSCAADVCRPEVDAWQSCERQVMQRLLIDFPSVNVHSRAYETDPANVGK